MSAEQPRVSIITTTLNSAAFIGEHLASVDAQLYPNIEHVFVDGGSTDGTVQMIKDYAANHNVRWVSEPDSGNSEAVNKGLQMTSGDVLVILPSDDLLFPWSVQTAADYLLARPEVDIVHGDSVARNVAQDVWHLRLHKPFTRGFMARTQCLTAQATYVRRKVVDEVGGIDPEIKHANDYDFWMRATDGRKVHTVREILAVFTKRPGASNMQEGATGSIEEEVAEIRARYLKSRGLALVLLRLWDRVYSAGYRRVLLVRMLYHSARLGRGRPNTGTHPPWPNFLSAHRVSVDSFWVLLRTLMPLRRAYEVRIEPTGETKGDGVLPIGNARRV